MSNLIAVVIPVTTMGETLACCARMETAVDVFELRVDAMEVVDIAVVAALLERVNRPCIVTLRPQRCGGEYEGSEAQRIVLLRQLMALQPDYLDIEHDVSGMEIDGLLGLSDKTRLIRSYHNFSHTPEDMDTVWLAMQHPGVVVYKCVTHAQSVLDGLQMMLFLKRYGGQKNVLVHCMGEEGKWTRVAAATLGNLWTYAAVDDVAEMAPGLLTVAELVDIYHLRSRGGDTQWYALIGDPVQQSIGHIYHNECFQREGIDAVYFKMRVERGVMERAVRAWLWS